jgi:hypothetical protein
LLFYQREALPSSGRPEERGCRIACDSPFGLH